MFSEAIRFENGQFHNLPYHIARMSLTCRAFNLPELNLQDLLATLTLPSDQALYKCRVAYSHDAPSITIVPYQRRSPGSCAFVNADWIEYPYKSTDRGDISRLLAEAATDEVIIVKNGFITDCSIGNVVLENEEGFFTPDTYLLNGTMRQQLLDTGLIKAIPLTPTDIFRFHTVHFINALNPLHSRTHLISSTL